MDYEIYLDRRAMHAYGRHLDPEGAVCASVLHAINEALTREVRLKLSHDEWKLLRGCVEMYLAAVPGVIERRQAWMEW